MGKMVYNLTRHDAADPDFVQRVQAAYVSAEQAEQALTATRNESEADAARLRMLGRMGLLADNGGAEEARRRMIARRERTGE